MPSSLDSLARPGAIAIALTRIGIGIGAFGFTRAALRGLGFADPDPATIALARLAGGRDVALGLHALAVRGDRRRLREASLIGAAVDAGDAIAFGALAAGQGIDRTAAINATLGTGGALAGLWVGWRLGR